MPKEQAHEEASPPPLLARVGSWAAASVGMAAALGADALGAVTAVGGGGWQWRRGRGRAGVVCACACGRRRMGHGMSIDGSNAASLFCYCLVGIEFCVKGETPRLLMPSQLY